MLGQPRNLRVGISLMKMSLALLDRAGADTAAAHLQGAIDLATETPLEEPGQSLSKERTDFNSAPLALEPLLRKLRLLGSLGPDEEQALAGLTVRCARVSPREHLVREGAIPEECCLLIDGYAARSKIAKDGGRQILSFHIAGDMLDLQHLLLDRSDHNIQAVTEATVLWIPMVQLRTLIVQWPAIGRAFWRDTLTDASIFREWVLNVGRRDAKTRIAHMLCEFIARCEAVGLGTPQRMNLPFTQEEIADATGLTSVHVNRMLRELTEEGLIARNGRSLEVRDWQQFQHAAEFDRAYLHAVAA